MNTMILPLYMGLILNNISRNDNFIRIKIDKWSDYNGNECCSSKKPVKISKAGDK